HPETKEPYRWSNGGLEQVKLEDLPYTRAAEAQTLVDDLVALIRDFGYKRAPSRPKTNGHAAAHDGGGGGDRDWQSPQANILVGRRLPDSGRTLAGKMIASGMNSGATVNMLRGMMESSQAPKDERWRARVSAIPAAVDSAVAKYGKHREARASPETDTSPETHSSPHPSPRSSPEPTTESPRLRATHNVFRKWLDKDYDIDVLDAV